jgi:hypothetical protein
MPPSPVGSLLCWPWSQGLHSPAQYSLCNTVPLRPAKLGIHTCRISTLPACTLQARQVHAPKACYFTSAKGLNPKACGTPTHHPLATESLQSYLTDTYRQVWMLKN